MKALPPLIIALVLILNSCSADKNRSVLLKDGTKAVGSISKDNVYNGLIKFYDQGSGELVSQSEYRNDTLHGETRSFLNTRLVTIENYHEGNLHGERIVYDREGHLMEIDNYYHGLRVGNALKYHSGKLKEYYFNSLEGKDLFNITYDSLKSKRLPDLIEHWFFYHLGKYATEDAYPLNYTNKELFIYTPNPRKFNFDYSLVVVDEKYNVDYVIESISEGKPWQVIDMGSPDLDPGKTLAIKLYITDSTADDNIVLFKRLN